MSRSILTLLIVALLAMAGRPNLAAAAPAGEVIGVSGQPVDKANGQQTPLKLGDSVQVGDTVTVPADGRLRLRMADGSIVSIASGSTMTVKAYSVEPATQHRDAELSLANGLLRAVVARVAQPSRFEVSTATGVAAARSTDWFVQAQPDSTDVSVLDGTVAFSGPATRHEVMIPPHSGSTIEMGHNPLPPHPVAQAAFETLIARTNVLGLCQCVANRNIIQTACLPTAEACESLCATNHYAFLPSASYSCAGKGR